MDQRRSTLSAQLAEQIRAERGAARLTRDELAKRSGLSPKTVQRLEENQREIDTNQLARICRALDITVLDFMTRAAARPQDRARP